MYTPPIQLFIKEETAKIEDMLYTQIKKIGIDVDKEELFRALRYERDQYNEGYKEGKARVIEEITKRMLARAQEYENLDYFITAQEFRYFAEEIKEGV